MPTALRCALGALLVLSVAACGDTPGLEPETSDLAGALAGDVEYATLVDLATRTGVLRDLEAAGPITVLAPTDLAFVYLGADLVPVLTDPVQRDRLARVLRHHIIPQAIGPDDFVDGATFTSLDGARLTVRRVGDIVLVDGATIDLDEVKVATNGLAYQTADVIQTNLTVRERVELAPSLRTFARLATRISVLDRVDQLDEVTLLVPTDDAFLAIDEVRELLERPSNSLVLRRVLEPHVIAGRVDLGTLPDGARVETVAGVTLTVENDNGVVTVGGARILREAVETADGRLYLLGDIVFEGITLADRLQIQPLVSLFPAEIRQETEVWARMNDPDEALTVFVPIDGAYFRRNTDVALQLSLPENEDLRRRTRRTVVVEGSFRPEDLTSGMMLQALDGSEHLVQRDGETLFVSGRRVSSVGTTTTNGVLYTSREFVPPRVDAFDTTILEGYTVFSVAIRRAGLVDLFRTSPLTFFPPTNNAFQGQANLLNRPDIADIVRFHATEASLPLLLEATEFETLTGAMRSIQILPFEMGSAQFLDGEARVVGARTAYNGVGRLFAVDSLMLPPAAGITQ